MSCIYKYKGKNYTKDEFYSLVSSSNFIQQEQARKFAELQERLNNKEFLKGAKNAFESSKGLQEWGTQEQYNDYIARVSLGIIKNPSSGEYNYYSKVKDIVYHGTRTQDKFDKFDENKIGELDSGYFGRGFYFSPDLAYANGYSKLYNGYNIAAILNLQNPLETDANKANTNISLNNNDGAIVRVGEDLLGLNEVEQDSNEIGEIVVTKSEQIHILGSKQDIEGFKEFVNDKQSVTPRQGISELFAENPRLASIGTMEQYERYLSTIFPDSKVRDIVYHRTNSDWFKTQLFSKNVKPVTGIGEDNKIPESQGAIYFYYKDKEGASNLTGKYIFPVILNIKTLGEYTGKGRIFNTASNKKILDDLENEIIKLENLANESQDLVLRKEKREQANKLLDVYNTLYDNNKIKQIAQLEEGQGLTYIKKWDFSYIDGITDYRWLLIPNPEQIHILGSKQDIEGFKEFVQEEKDDLNPFIDGSNKVGEQIRDVENIQETKPNKQLDLFDNNAYYQLPKSREKEEYVASEKTIRDLAARMSDRIGIPVKFESDRSKKYKGKIENNIAYVNLAYATLDTPIHEILGHPIIRAIKNSNNQLYQNLLKELEYGRGKEVLDRIKRDYVIKDLKYTQKGQEVYKNGKLETAFFNEADAANYIKEKSKYTLEEQQEEAIVELIGLLTAQKLNKITDKNLISLLKQLLKQINDFIKSLLNSKELNINDIEADNTKFLIDNKLKEFIKNGTIRKEC